MKRVRGRMCATHALPVTSKRPPPSSAYIRASAPASPVGTVRRSAAILPRATATVRAVKDGRLTRRDDTQSTETRPERQGGAGLDDEEHSHAATRAQREPALAATRAPATQPPL